MGLLAPWFLAGIAAVGLPIYVHLLRRHTTKPRPFSSLMFFERRTQSSIKHRRLRYLLLLSLRALLFLLLVLAFANPFINRTAASMNSEKLLLLVIDNSFSMRAGTRLADAKREALSVLSSRRPAGQGAGDGARFAASGADAAVARFRRAARRRRQHAAGRFARQLRRTRARGALACRNRCTRPSSCIFSATCRNPRCPRSFSELALPANVSLVLHPVAKEAVPNWTVESVNAPGQVWDPKKARVQAVIAGFGTPAATRTVSLVVNGKTVATQNRGRARERPRHRRISVARRALRLHPLRSAHRFGGHFSRGRREPFRRRAIRPAPRALRFRRGRLALAALFPLRARLGRGIRLHAATRSAPARRRISSSRSTRSWSFRT